MCKNCWSILWPLRVMVYYVFCLFVFLLNSFYIALLLSFLVLPSLRILFLFFTSRTILVEVTWNLCCLFVRSIYLDLDIIYTKYFNDPKWRRSGRKQEPRTNHKSNMIYSAMLGSSLLRLWNFRDKPKKLPNTQSSRMDFCGRSCVVSRLPIC